MYNSHAGYDHIQYTLFTMHDPFNFFQLSERANIEYTIYGQ